MNGFAQKTLNMASAQPMTQASLPFMDLSRKADSTPAVDHPKKKDQASFKDHVQKQVKPNSKQIAKSDDKFQFEKSSSLVEAASLTDQSAVLDSQALSPEESSTQIQMHEEGHNLNEEVNQDIDLELAFMSMPIQENEKLIVPEVDQAAELVVLDTDVENFSLALEESQENVDMASIDEFEVEPLISSEIEAVDITAIHLNSQQVNAQNIEMESSTDESIFEIQTGVFDVLQEGKKLSPQKTSQVDFVLDDASDFSEVVEPDVKVLRGFQDSNQNSEVASEESFSSSFNDMASLDPKDTIEAEFVSQDTEDKLLLKQASEQISFQDMGTELDQPQQDAGLNLSMFTDRNKVVNSLEMPMQPSMMAPSSQVVEQVRFMMRSSLGAGQDEIIIQLQPEELGRVSVKLQIQDNKVNAIVQADQKETLKLLQQESKALEKALEDSGLEIQDNGLSFAFSQSGFEQQQDRKELMFELHSMHAINEIQQDSSEIGVQGQEVQYASAIHEVIYDLASPVFSSDLLHRFTQKIYPQPINVMA